MENKPGTSTRKNAATLNTLIVIVCIVMYNYHIGLVTSNGTAYLEI